jgi:RNase H-fold protein (predicted Holliday junction resolvase)
MKTILAIDPGREKCGLAVVTTLLEVLHKQVVQRDNLVQAAASLARSHDACEIIVGNGTGSGKAIDELRGAISIPIQAVDEACSSQRARSRFLDDNPPRGIRRLIPRGLLTPYRPYDDYVAIILAEDYLSLHQG